MTSLVRNLLCFQTLAGLVTGIPTKIDPAAHQLEARAAWTNPLFDGWYADPDIDKFNGQYWIYPTVSAGSGGVRFDAFSSPNLAQWTKHASVFTPDDSNWATEAFWAPCTVQRYGKYYFYYTANKPSSNTGTAGIGVARGDSPSGPFTEILDHPLVGAFHNGGAAMDQQVFVDDDGKHYLIWGNPQANIAVLNDDMKSLGKFPDGSGIVKITPNEGYLEGPYMLKRNGKYYFMWSEDVYTSVNYRVAYAISDSLTGPFNRIGTILSRNASIADAPGHHSVLKDSNGEYYICYHRRAVGASAERRVVAIDRLYFNSDGTIKPVVMT